MLAFHNVYHVFTIVRKMDFSCSGNLPQKSKKQIAVLPVILSFIRTPIFFGNAKISGTKVIKGSILASDVWLSDQNLMFFADFWIFKLMVKYNDTPATERYFVKLFLVVRYTICKRMVVRQECIRC